MTDETPNSPSLSAVGSPEFERQQHESAMKRANAIIDWLLAHPRVSQPFQSAEFMRAFPGVTRADVKLALDEVARIAAT